MEAMYGARDAAQRWQNNLSQIARELGFTTGRASPCHFCPSARRVCGIVHGARARALGLRTPRVQDETLGDGIAEFFGLDLCAGISIDFSGLCARAHVSSDCLLAAWARAPCTQAPWDIFSGGRPRQRRSRGGGRSSSHVDRAYRSHGSGTSRGGVCHAEVELRNPALTHLGPQMATIADGNRHSSRCDAGPCDHAKRVRAASW